MLQSREKWIIAFIATTMAFLEVMDMVIVSVSLRSMEGALSANASEISWTMSIYVIANAIVTPVSGFLVMKFGRRTCLLWCIAGFAVMSCACGFAESLTLMLFFRALQGAFGAPLAPIAQSIMAELFQGAERNKAMALFSIGIMTAPLFGPIIGGYINDAISWRFIFFINIPICILVFFMAVKFVNETEKHFYPVDWKGFAFLIIGIGALQFVLQQGNYDDWFSSNWIILFSLISVLFLYLFIIYSKDQRNPVINLHILKDKNFTVAIFLAVMFNAGFFATMSIMPIQLEATMNFPASFVGFLLSPRGAASIIAMLLMPFIMKRVQSNYLVMIGFLSFAVANYFLSQESFTLVNLNMIIVATVIQGIATAFFFVPLSVMAYSTLDRTLSPQASGVFNFARAFGGSVGISLATLFQENMAQKNWNFYTTFLRPGSQHLNAWLQGVGSIMNQQLSYAELQNQVSLKSTILGYANTYILISILLLLGLLATVGYTVYQKKWIFNKEAIK